MSNPAFQGARATYVALCGVVILGLALITSIWHADVSGTIALLGLLSIYMSSSELLVLFMVLAPLSAGIDIIRLATGSAGVGVRHGRGWLITFTVLEILAKAAGSLFAWSLHRSIGAGGDGGGAYAPIGAGGPAGGLMSPPTNMGGSSMYGAGGPGSLTDSGYQRGGTAGGAGGIDSGDPFAAYAPPRSEHAGGVAPVSTYQPFPSHH